MIRTVLVGVALSAGLVTTAPAATFKAECDEGASIQKRLDQNAKPGDTIEVSGTCNEQIVVRTNNVRLTGLDGATIDGGTDSSEGNSVIVVRALDVRISGLTVTGGRNGIVVSRNASAIIGGTAPGQGNTIDTVGRNGISISEDGWAQLLNNTITDAARFGIAVSGGSATLSGNEVRGSDRDGLFVGTSFVDLEGANTFLANGRRGIACARAGILRVQAIQTLVAPPPDNNVNGPYSNTDGSCSVFADVSFP